MRLRHVHIEREIYIISDVNSEINTDRWQLVVRISSKRNGELSQFCRNVKPALSQLTMSHFSDKGVIANFARFNRLNNDKGIRKNKREEKKKRSDVNER